jgi:DNA-binding transcriptional ArsR family regulator
VSASASLDRVFQALADPTRRALVERLSLGPASVSELALPLPMSLPAVVQHLQVLEASGLIRSEKQGRVRTCRVEPTALRDVEQWASARRASWEQRFDRLGAYLAEQARGERADAAETVERTPSAKPALPRRPRRPRGRSA